MALTIRRADPGAPDSVRMMDALSDTLATITGASGRASFDPDDVRGARACFVLARDAEGLAVGCGAFRPISDTVAEVKRMYAAPGTRGVGSAILAFLEKEARALGYAEVWLETRLVNQRAVSFYERRAYQRIANYGKYVGKAEAVCLAKRLR